MLAGTEFERMLAATNVGLPMDQTWEPFTAPFPSPLKAKSTTKRHRSGDEASSDRQAPDARKRKSQSTPVGPPSLGRLKMQALLQREQEILKAKDESPYPTPVEETSHSLLLKSYQKQQAQQLSGPPPSLLLAPPGGRPYSGGAYDLLHAARGDPQQYQHDPMVLNYFYMYLDLLESRENCELDRHPLALLTKTDPASCGTIEMRNVCHDRFPKLVEMCDRGISLQEFMHVKLNLDLNMLQPGDFHNISVLETSRPRTVECTTTVYHFGQRILETKEVQYPHQPATTTAGTTGNPEQTATTTTTTAADDYKSAAANNSTYPQHSYATRSRRPAAAPADETAAAAAARSSSNSTSNNMQREEPTTKPVVEAKKRNLYHFDFVKRFFSTFLAGLHCFDMEVEKRIAVDNLSVIQVFEDISAPFDLPHSVSPPLLCICYQFECGKGEAKALFIEPPAGVRPSYL
ncbi:hypothetical protein HDU86_003686 [Geranomyces michiganensis]|nr:hypothetical protein HDU86_003686 [Geranomyces michiganensis]